MKLNNRLIELMKKENECEEEKSQIIEDIAEILTNNLGLEFSCSDSDDEKVFYFEAVELSGWRSICIIKINLYCLELIYVSCDDVDFKEKVYKLFEKGLDI